MMEVRSQVVVVDGRNEITRGWSDQLALAANCRRRSPALAAEGISCSKFSTRSLKIAISRFAPDLY
jgi:hypothetical protein